MNIQATISEAIAEVANEVRSGVPVEKAIADVASDFDLKVGVLTARFDRAYPESVPAAAPSLTACIADAVARTCKRYNIAADRTMLMFTRSGVKITAICRDGSEVIAVRHTDGAVRRYAPRAFNDAAVRFTANMNGIAL